MEDHQPDRARLISELRQSIQVIAHEYSLEYNEEERFAQVRGNGGWLLVDRLDEGFSYFYLNAAGQPSSETRLDFAEKMGKAGFTEGYSFMTVQETAKNLLMSLHVIHHPIKGTSNARSPRRVTVTGSAKRSSNAPGLAYNQIPLCSPSNICYN